MKKIYIIAIVLTVFFSIGAPFSTLAQVVDDTEAPSGMGWWRQSSQMQQKIAALGDVAEAEIAMPVLFGVAIKDISPNFGVLRASGRIHEGEDIMAVKGTPMVSPTAAVVIRIDYGAGEGNAVYTANPGGETFIYYHLDRIGEGLAEGQVLLRGSLIGYVGNTGDAAGGAAHLHFEIRKGTGNVATDPFLRLKINFTPEEKIAYLSNILAQSADQNALAKLLVVNFRSEFLAASARGVALPQVIKDFLVSLPNTSSGSILLPAGDLAMGSSGTDVTALQRFLIKRAAGTAAKNLGYAGATGYFGALTKAALVEYQVKVGVLVADGYYGPLTQAAIKAEQEAVLPLPSSPGTLLVLTRDLYIGMSGEDVRLLQTFLNLKGFTVAAVGPGSRGYETVYFGTATRAAVVKYQITHGIRATGNVSTLTRASIVLSGG